MKVAVVTPYYKEDEALLRQAHDSVLAQRVACRHILIADGEPKPALDGWDAWHVRLGQCHDDYGDTPRAIGALMAAARGFDAVAFLDADNWYEPNHVASLIDLHGRTGAVVCTSGRQLRAVDGSLLLADDGLDYGVGSIDTNSLFVTRSAFAVLPLWATIPRWLAAIGDCVFWMGVLASGATTAHSGEPTICYRSRAAGHYAAAGLPPPPEAARWSEPVHLGKLAWCRLSPRRKIGLLFQGDRRALAPSIDDPLAFRRDLDPRLGVFEEKCFRDRLSTMAAKLLEDNRRAPDPRRGLRHIEAIYRALMASFPEHAPSAHGLGLVLALAGRADEAMPLLQRAVALAPETALFRANLASAFQRAGRNAEAAHELGRAVALEPANARYRDGLAALRRALDAGAWGKGEPPMAGRGGPLVP